MGAKSSNNFISFSEVFRRNENYAKHETTKVSSVQNFNGIFYKVFEKFFLRFLKKNLRSWKLLFSAITEIKSLEFIYSYQVAISAASWHSVLQFAFSAFSN